jgi:hypothetical protein
VTDLVFKRLEETREQPRYRWDALLNPEPTSQRLRAVAASAGTSDSSIIPAPVREIGSEIVSGVGDIVTDAASAVSEIVESVIATQPRTAKGQKKEGATKEGKSKKVKGKTKADL